MNKLLTFGCSLTYDIGMKERLAELCGYELLSFAQTAGSNGLQICKFQEYILQNLINKDDIVLWQITSPTRNHVRLYPNDINLQSVCKIQQTEFAPIDRYHYIQNSFNVFDSISRLDMLCNSPYSLVDFDSNEQLQNVLCNIIMCSKIYPKTLVLFGWSEMISDHEKNILHNYLNFHKIPFIGEYYVNWVKDNKLKMWDDDYHPAKESGELFAEQVLYKRIKELKYI